LSNLIRHLPNNPGGSEKVMYDKRRKNINKKATEPLSFPRYPKKPKRVGGALWVALAQRKGKMWITVVVKDKSFSAGRFFEGVE